jgi:hypothetical protein
LNEPPNWRDRSTKMLRYLADVIVNDNPDVKYVDPNAIFLEPQVPPFDANKAKPAGTRDQLKAMGREAFVDWLKKERPFSIPIPLSGMLISRYWRRVCAPMICLPWRIAMRITWPMGYFQSKCGEALLLMWPCVF